MIIVSLSQCAVKVSADQRKPTTFLGQRTSSIFCFFLHSFTVPGPTLSFNRVKFNHGGLASHVCIRPLSHKWKDRVRQSVFQADCPLSAIKHQHPVPSNPLKTEGWGSISISMAVGCKRTGGTVHRGKWAVSVPALLSGDQRTDTPLSRLTPGCVCPVCKQPYIEQSASKCSIRRHSHFSRLTPTCQSILIFAKLLLRASLLFALGLHCIEKHRSLVIMSKIKYVMKMEIFCKHFIGMLMRRYQGRQNIRRLKFSFNIQYIYSCFS